jgi:hypothetical protein
MYVPLISSSLRHIKADETMRKGGTSYNSGRSAEAFSSGIDELRFALN